METEFPLPPVNRFAPSYRLHIKFKRSLSAKFASTMKCKDVRRRQSCAETVLIEDPLHSEAVVPVSAAPFSDSDEIVDIDAACEELLMIKRCTGSFPDVASPCSVHSLHRPNREASFGPSCTLGQLRVQGLLARGIQWHPGELCRNYGGMCCRLSFGAMKARTHAVPYNASPAWNEVLDFPMLAGELHGEVLLELLGIVDGQELLLGRTRVPTSTVLISSNGNNRALVSQRLEGEAMGSNACVNMELLFLPDEPGCGEETSASEDSEGLVAELQNYSV
jgi:hypothetical protein